MPSEASLMDVHGLKYEDDVTLYMKNSVVSGYFLEGQFVVDRIVTSYCEYDMDNYGYFNPDKVKDRDAVFTELLLKLKENYSVDVIVLNGDVYRYHPVDIINLLKE